MANARTNTLRLLIGVSCAIVLLPFIAAGQQVGEGTISAVVRVQEQGKPDPQPPNEEIRFIISRNGRDPVTRWSKNDGSLISAGHKPGKWTIAVQWQGYRLLRKYYVEVNSTGLNEPTPRPLVLATPTPTPTPTPQRGSRTPETEPLAHGARLVLVLYREPQEPRKAPTPTPKPSCENREPGKDLNISGRVSKDAANVAGLEGAEVSLYAIDCESRELALRGHARTDKDGNFSLPIARYYPDEEHMLFVTHEGYEAYNEEFDVKANQGVNVSLAGESMETTMAAVEVESVEATRRYVFNTPLMETLPVPGFRSFDTFALLAPGVAPPPATFGTSGPGVSSGVGTSGIFTINGLRSRENNFTVDGSDNNDEDIGTRRQGFVILIPQAVESIQEFQVITALADARFGRNIGGQVNALTKSGGQGLHGTLYGYFTNDRFNARDFFDSTAPDVPATFTPRRSIDGKEVMLDGRPLVVSNPATGKNKHDRKQMGLAVGGRLITSQNFFFFSAERQTLAAEQETHFAVPAVRQRGIFGLGETGAVATLGFQSVTTLFPASIPGNAVFSLYPFPNNPRGPYGENNYTALLPADGKGTRFALKLERDFLGEGEPRVGSWLKALFSRPAYGDHLAARYNFTDERSTIPVTGGAIFSALRPKVRTQNVALFYNRRLSARMNDSLRLSFGRTRLFFREALDPSLSRSTFLPDTPFLLNAPLLLNISRPGQNSTNYVTATSLTGRGLLNEAGLPGVTRTEAITGPLGQVMLAGFSPVGVDVYNFPQERANNTWQVGENLNYVLDNHVLNFGADLRRTEINSTLDRNFRPLAVFGGLYNTFFPPASGLNITVPSDVSQALLPSTTLAAMGAPTGFFQTLAKEPNSDIGLRFSQVNLFFQDNWRLKSYFRVTYGVRYELNTVPKSVGGKLEKAFDPAELRGNIQRALADCGPERCADLTGALTAAFPADFTVSFGSDRNDFDFRLGFVFDPGDAGRFAIRGGFGTYSGQFPGIVLSQSRNAFPDFLPLNYARSPVTFSSPDVRFSNFLFNLANPNVRALNPALLGVVTNGTLNAIPNVNPISLLVNSLPVSFNTDLNEKVGLNLVLPQKELQTPYSYQYSLGVEGEWPRGYIMSAAYVGTRGVGLLRMSTPDRGLLNNQVVIIDANATVGRVPFPVIAARSDGPQSRISNSFTIARTLFESSASSTYHSLQSELRKRYDDNFQFGMALTYSHAIDDASDFLDTAGAFALPQNSLRRSERGPSSYDARLRLVSHFIVDIHEKLLFLNLGKRLGGWQVAGIVTNQTGQPFTVNSAFDINRDGNLTDRLNSTNGLIVGPVNGDDRVRLQLRPGVRTMDLLAPDGRDGAVGRNTFRANGIANVDLSVTKFWHTGLFGKVQIRTEVFNLFNRTHFAIPERILESPAFGASTRTTIPARTIQFALKLSF